MPSVDGFIVNAGLHNRKLQCLQSYTIKFHVHYNGYEKFCGVHSSKTNVGLQEHNEVCVCMVRTGIHSFIIYFTWNLQLDL